MSRLNQILAEFHQDMLRVEADRIKEDPAAHRDTTVFEGPMRWRYFVLKRAARPELRFCWSTTPNAAGYYLTWQETRTKKGGKREYIRGHKLRKDARESALKSYQNAAGTVHSDPA